MDAESAEGTLRRMGYVCVPVGKYILNEIKCNTRIRIIMDRMNGMDRIQMAHPTL